MLLYYYRIPRNAEQLLSSECLEISHSDAVGRNLFPWLQNRVTGCLIS